MKKLTLFMLISLMCFSIAKSQSVKFNPEMPEAGKTLTFEYESKGGALEKLAKVTCVAQTFVNKVQKIVDVSLVKEGTVYKGSFTPVDSTAFAVLVFSADGVKDGNTNGYYTLFYEKGKPTAMAYYWESQFYNGMGAFLAGTGTDKAKSLAAFEKAFAMDPIVRKTYMAGYLNLQYSLDKVKGEKMMLDEIADLNKTADKKEQDFLTIANYYSVLKRKPAADSIYAIVKANYPKGVYLYNLASREIYSEKDPAKAEEKLKKIVTDFDLNANKKDDALKLENLYAQIARTYSLKNNNDKFEEYANRITNKTTLASLYNTYAWASAEKNENLEFASKISKKSIELIEAAKNEPRPVYVSSQEQYLKNLKSNYAAYADTYALLLANLNRYDEAVKFQEEAFANTTNIDPAANARYVNYLAKAKQDDKVLKFAEKFIKDGQGTEEMKIALKAAYKGSVPFDTYYAALEKEANEKEMAKFMKEMINQPAPTFALLNVKGEKVDLAKLKGKVVIVDYWATWCGPCISSFPGMQKAVDKYKSDPNVAFLFVNTWQNEENREKVVKDWLAANPAYTFNVLLDTKNAKDPSKYDVIEQYKVEGIPTKFIIDGNGNIRFKKVGFSGSADGTVKELDMMIALAKDPKTASK